MRVRFNKLLGACLIVVNTIFIVGNVIIYQDTVLRLILSLVMPGTWLIVGLIAVTQTFVVIGEHTLVVYPLLGPWKEQYTFSSLQDVSIERQNIWIRQHNQWKRISFPLWLADKYDRQALITFVQQHQ